jgi:small subunit ribosomal protein S13
MADPKQSPQSQPAKENPKEFSKDFKHIVRIANVDLPGNKVIRVALRKIKGIGSTFADVACILARIDRGKKAGDLSEENLKRLNDIILNPLKNGIPVWLVNRRKDCETGETSHLLTGNLQFIVDNDLKRLKKIKCYRGVRHIHGQPVRGQRTKSNFRKNKGKVVGVKKKVAPTAAAAPAKK